MSPSPHTLTKHTLSQLVRTERWPPSYPPAHLARTSASPSWERTTIRLNVHTLTHLHTRAHGEDRAPLISGGICHRAVCLLDKRAHLWHDIRNDKYTLIFFGVQTRHRESDLACSHPRADGHTEGELKLLLFFFFFYRKWII